jgi:hypothetical protein
MLLDQAAPAVRYVALNERINEDVAYLSRHIRSARRASLISRGLIVALIFAASVLPLVTQIASLSAIPSWTATLAIVMAGGILMIDKSGMWTEDFTRWNTRLMETMAFRDNFDAKYARLLRLLGENPDRMDEDKLLAHIEDAFRAIGAMRQAESIEWSAQYQAVLNSLGTEIRGRGGNPEVRSSRAA